MSYTKNQVFEFQDYMLERACHMDRTFFVFGKGNGEMPNIPWLEFFHFQLLQILVPRFTSFGWKFRHIFSQTYILWRCKALDKIPLVYIFGGHLICMNIPPRKEEGSYTYSQRMLHL
jgi:hypothetical protein